MNRDSGIHPNMFLGTILTQKKCQNVCDSKGLQDGASVRSSTIDKLGELIFRDFAADRDFGTYHILFLGVKLLPKQLPYVFQN